MTEEAIDPQTAEFERHRSHLMSVGYRLTGSVADAEDAVTETWLRWREHADEVDEPRAWLTRVTSRICLDLLRSSQRRRESYTGPWLPEPVVSAPGQPPNPLDEVVADDSVRLAFLVVLDQLKPEQRVAVVLHDALDVPFAEIAEVLGSTEAAARQYAARGRKRLATAPPPPRPSDAEVNALLGRLTAALSTGDANEVATLLAPDAVLISDGGGVVRAAHNVLHGRDKVSRYLTGLSRQIGADQVEIEPIRVNGQPGWLGRAPQRDERDAPLAVMTCDVSDGQVESIYVVLAPDKLGGVPESLSSPRSELRDEQ